MAWIPWSRDDYRGPKHSKGKFSPNMFVKVSKMEVPLPETNDPGTLSSKLLGGGTIQKFCCKQNERDVHTQHISYPAGEHTGFAPKSGWLEYDRFLLGFRLFSGSMLASGSVLTHI